jgi:hypothetical protein
VEKAAAELGMTRARPIPSGLDHRGEEIPWSDLLPRLGTGRVEIERPKDGRRPLLPVAIDGLSIMRALGHSAHVVEIDIDARLARTRVMRLNGVLAAGVIHAPELSSTRTAA